MAEKTDLEIIYRKPGDLTPDPRNARTHSARQLSQIQESIKKFGFTAPVLLRSDSSTIGAGHGRWMAAKKLKLAKIPTITLSLTEAQWKAYAIADNAIPLGASWDMDILRAELDEIAPADLDGLGLDTLLTELKPEAAAPTRTGSRVSQSVIQFNIIFDNEEQQGRWHAFVRQLKADPEYRGCKTFAEKLDKFLSRAAVTA